MGQIICHARFPNPPWETVTNTETVAVSMGHPKCEGAADKKDELGLLLLRLVRPFSIRSFGPEQPVGFYDIILRHRAMMRGNSSLGGYGRLSDFPNRGQSGRVLFELPIDQNFRADDKCSKIGPAPLGII